MLLLISFLTFTIMFIIAYIVLTTYVPVKGAVEMRLKALDAITAGRTDIDEELAKSFKDRVLSPLTGSVATSLVRFTPHSIRIAAEEKMVAAGGFGGLTVDEFLLLTGTLTAAVPMVISIVLMLAGFPAAQIMALGLLFAFIAAFFPFTLLNQKIAARKKSIQKDLPDVLDLLTVSVEAGLGFDGALAKLSEKMKGALVEEFTRVLQEIRMGVTRREALRNMGHRCGVEDLSLFTTSLVQADQLGVSIGQVLRVQSVSMREKRRQRAQEAGMKAPVKLLFPLVFFIFPTIFVVLLGPAVIQIMETFMSR